MKLKKIVTLFSLVIALGSTSIAFAQDFKKQTIRLSHAVVEDNPLGMAAQKFQSLLAEQTQDKMKVRIFPRGTLGPDEQLVNSLISGSLELAVVSAGFVSNHVHEFGVFDLPFLFESHDVADKVLDGAEGQKLLSLLPAKGLVGLNYWENGFRHITNSKKEISKVSDLEGLKLRVMQNQVALNVFKGLGANALPLAFTELFSALETKTVDGQENPLVLIRSSKFYEVQPYLTLSRHVYTPYVFLASKKWWDKLTDDEKSVVQKAASEAQKFQRERSRIAEKEALDFFKSQNILVSEFSAEERSLIQEKVKPIIEALKPKIGQRTVDAILNKASSQ